MRRVPIVPSFRQRRRRTWVRLPVRHVLFCVRVTHRRALDISRARRDLRIRLVPHRFHRPDSHSHSHSLPVVELCLCTAPTPRAALSRLLLSSRPRGMLRSAVRLRPFPAAPADFIPLHLRHSLSLGSADAQLWRCGSGRSIPCVVRVRVTGTEI